MNIKSFISIKTIIILALILAIMFTAYKMLDSQKAPEPTVTVENQSIADSTVILERV